MKPLLTLAFFYRMSLIFTWEARFFCNVEEKPSRKINEINCEALTRILLDLGRFFTANCHCGTFDAHLIARNNKRGEVAEIDSLGERRFLWCCVQMCHWRSFDARGRIIKWGHEERWDALYNHDDNKSSLWFVKFVNKMQVLLFWRQSYKCWG